MPDLSTLVPDPKAHLSVADAATLLRLHQETIRRWIKAGQLPALKLGKGGKLWVRREDLATFLGGREVGLPMRERNRR
jgi:excisionase family DNA binding protein